MPEREWIPLLRADQCPVGKVRYVAVGDHELAVFHLADPDRFIVTLNSCPHAGGNLSAGDIENNTITCPWHQWCFHLDSGECTFNEKVTLHRYECRIENGSLLARLD